MVSNEIMDPVVSGTGEPLVLHKEPLAETHIYIAWSGRMTLLVSVYLNIFFADIAVLVRISSVSHSIPIDNT